MPRKVDVLNDATTALSDIDSAIAKWATVKREIAAPSLAERIERTLYYSAPANRLMNPTKEWWTDNEYIEAHNKKILRTDPDPIVIDFPDCEVLSLSWTIAQVTAWNHNDAQSYWDIDNVGKSRIRHQRIAPYLTTTTIFGELITEYEVSEDYDSDVITAIVLENHYYKDESGDNNLAVLIDYPILDFVPTDIHDIVQTYMESHYER